MGRLRDLLREAWELAQARPPVIGQLRTYPMEVGGRAGARAAISSEGHLGVLVPVAPDQRRVIPRSLVPGSGSALDADYAEYAEGPERHRFLGLWCHERSLNDVFASFGEALLERWGQGNDAVVAAESCHADFRHLLSGPRSVQKAALVGLVGELLFLADLVDALPSDFDTWCADTTERHDFRRGNYAVEVKTTLRSATTGQVVHVSSIDQLEPPIGGDLYLHLVQLEEVTSGAISVSTLMKRLEARLDRDRFERMRARVMQIGLPADGQSSATFIVLNRSTYHVRDSFPRLTKSRLVSQQLDVGVRSVQYDLDLAACRSFAVDNHVALRCLSTPRTS